MNENDVTLMLCPEKDILHIEDGIAIAKIMDAELDIIECTFNGNNSVELDTTHLTNVQLTINNLETLIELIYEEQELNKNS